MQVIYEPELKRSFCPFDHLLNTAKRTGTTKVKCVRAVQTRSQVHYDFPPKMARGKRENNPGIISLARGYLDWYISQWLTWEALTVD